MSEILTPAEAETIQIIGGFAHPELTQKIAHSIGANVCDIAEKIHPNGELYTRFNESVRGKKVFIVQSHIRTPETSVNDAIMEQLLMLDAARSSSAAEITAVAPYLAYARQDRKSKGREPIGTRVLLDTLKVNGANRIMTVDLHSPQAQGIFRGPFDHLTAQPALRDAMVEELANIDRDEVMVVAPDAGAAKMAEQHQTELGASMFVMSKRRDPKNNQNISRDDRFPYADGKHCLVFDDMIDTAGTLVSAAEALQRSGAKSIRVAATHGVLSDPALKRLQNSPIDKILITDTFATGRAQEALGDRLQVISIAPIIGSAILRVIRHESISEMFCDQNHR